MRHTMDKQNEAQKELQEAYNDPRGDIMWRAGLVRAMAIVEKYYGTTPTPPAGRAEAVADMELCVSPEAIVYWLHNDGSHRGLNSADAATINVAIKASGAEHIAGLVGALEKIFVKESLSTKSADAIKDGTTWRIAHDALEALPPELRFASQSKIDSDQSNCETI